MAPGVAVLPSLSSAHWPSDAYRRHELPERVLQFGTGMLLRALCASSIDAANRAGRFNGRVLVVQSTPHGTAAALNAQDGLFTLVERGLQNGASIERTRLVGAVSRALSADAQWRAVREAVTRPELQVIVSNVTEAGFRPDDDAPPLPAAGGDDSAPPSFPAKLTDVLHARFARLSEGPPVYVIPTELVPDNGARLAAMIDRVAARAPDAQRFRDWLARHVRFCASLVDRITTGAPAARERAALETRLGYADALLTVAEPYSFWAIEGDPDALRSAFAIDGAPGGGGEGGVVFAPDIGTYAERKLRLLNGAHTALAPLALLAGVRTVRDAAEHPRLGPFLRRVLFDELVPGTALPAPQAQQFATSVLERFHNPWLEHEWRVIATNQTAKMRVRVAPAIQRYAAGRGESPVGLALACAAHLRYLRPEAGTSGSWHGVKYPIVDADLALVARHWQAVLPDPATQPGPPLPAALERLVARALADSALWSPPLAQVPGFLDACTHSLIVLERDGVEAALSHD